NVTMDELALLTVTNTASDADIPVNGLTYALLAPPAGAQINPTNGVITWTPAEDQGPGSNTITSVVTDDGVPALSATNEFEVVVDEVNAEPVFDETPTNVTMDELTLLTVTNTASDADIPVNALTYALLAPPAGAQINPTNGVITWTPAESQGPGANTITSVVTDNGSPVLSATNSFEVVVTEVNTAPVLSAVADATIHATAPFSVAIAATDSDIPTNTLTFSLVSGPTGVLVNAGSGLFTWTPDTGDVGSTNAVTVKVQDSGIPVLSDTETFALIAVNPLAFTSMQVDPSGSAEVTWNAISGQTYRVWYIDDLVDGSWSNLVPDVVADGPSASQVDAAASNEVLRFYDVFQME
ncbi:MAG: cadherin repeat domain-containing protein, partial [Lentisphaerae bacterium]|nr:cadherin repeat domain-containing protein [Lentisphaerota bacterium]